MGAWSEMDARLSALERERCQALADHDMAKLEALLAEDYVHVHSNGRVERRGDWLAAIAAGPPRTVQRGALEIAEAGGVAVMFGPVVTTIFVDAGAPRVIDGTATQAWAPSEDGWKLLSFQVTSRVEDGQEGPRR
jgi:ketosteroid isomerase-like protein